MVKEFYVCEACGFAYKERSLSGKCESWCKERSSCNLEIVKNSVGELRLRGGKDDR